MAEETLETITESEKPAVFLLEDNPKIAEITREILEGHGYQVVTCSDYKSAHEHLLKGQNGDRNFHDYVAFVLDHNLTQDRKESEIDPDMVSGSALAAFLSILGVKSQKIIIYSGSLNGNISYLAKELGIRCLQKPASMEVLVKEVRLCHTEDTPAKPYN